MVKEPLRQSNAFDTIIKHIDHSLRTVFVKPIAERTNPAAHITNTKPLDGIEPKHVAGLMRVNHTGEVCAQALYHAQAITARKQNIKEHMLHSAREEDDHLNWCLERLEQLNARPSIFNPIWYSGAFTIGLLAGAMGDKWSLGFVAETEHQVVKHLEDHLQQLPSSDDQTQVLLEQMRVDEHHHEHTAINTGGMNLPNPVKSIMKLCAKVMTTISYRL